MSERKSAPNVDSMFTLKVDNISFKTTPESLKEHFGKYGEIGDVYIPRNFGSSDPRGFAFVRFLDKQDAEDAQRALDGTEMDGRDIKIQEARERRAENPRDAMSSRGYRGRDDRYGDDRRGGYDSRRNDDRGRGRRGSSRSRSYDRGSRRHDDRRDDRRDRRSRSRSNDHGRRRDRESRSRERGSR